MDSNNIHIQIKALRNNHALPAYMTAQAAGMDLTACIAEPVVLQTLERFLVPCGFSIALPAGFEAQIRPRSGLALKHGITCLNSPGTIDADYRGEVHALLVNLSNTPFVIEPNMRIAQMVIAHVHTAVWNVVDELPTTQRGDGGFGSTGSSSRGVTTHMVQ